METSTTLAVIGSGSWPTALVKILMEQKVKIRWWLRKEEDAAFVREHRHNPTYLSNIHIKPGKVRVYSDINRAVAKADHIVLAVPSIYIPAMLDAVNPELWEGKTIVSGTKGMCGKQLVTDYIQDRLGLEEKQFVVIAGPCHAEEVALERLSYLTLAGLDEQRAAWAAELLQCRYILTNWHTDIYGAEYCAVMKNIIAIACGISNGLGNGDNFQAVLVANGFREMKSFIDHAFPQHRQMIDTAYLGDLLVTAYSQFSRNRTFGNMIGKGYTISSAQHEMNMVAEGFFAVKHIKSLNDELFHVDLPIIEAVYAICHLGKNVRKVMEELTEKLK